MQTSLSQLGADENVKPRHKRFVNIALLKLFSNISMQNEIFWKDKLENYSFLRFQPVTRCVTLRFMVVKISFKCSLHSIGQVILCMRSRIWSSGACDVSRDISSFKSRKIKHLGSNEPNLQLRLYHKSACERLNHQSAPSRYFQICLWSFRLLISNKIHVSNIYYNMRFVFQVFNLMKNNHNLTGREHNLISTWHAY